MTGESRSEDRLREYLKRVTVDLSEARRRLAEAEADRNEPIAIVGMACRYPGGVQTPEGFWDLLREGRDPVSKVPQARWDIDEYYEEDRRVTGGVYTRDGAFLDEIADWDAGAFGLSPQEAFRMDPQQRLLMELLWESLENAGTSPTKLAGSRTGVLVGLMDTIQYGRMEMELYGQDVVADPYFSQGISTSVAAGRLAYQFDLRGPTMTIDTACSSSLVGVHLASEALRRGECDLAVAGGAYLIIRPDTFVVGCATSMLAADSKCKTFDASADGYVLGEGGGMVVLERLSSALRNGRRIRAVLRGSAVNQDGRSNGLTAPSRGAQVDVIRRALSTARVNPDEVGYVEAHGSGTHLGDAIELSALHDVFGTEGRRTKRSPLHVGAVKTNIGHTQSAAGVAGLIKTVLVLENGGAPANLHTENPSESIPADGTVRPITAPVALAGDKVIAGVSSFGWAGTNAHVVLETAPRTDTTNSTDASRGNRSEPAVLPLSAAGPAALRARADGLATWLAEHPALDLADVAHTLQTGAAELSHRRAVVCQDRAEALRQLKAEVPGQDAAHGPTVAFLLPGTGDQYLGLGRELYDSEPVFAAAVDECLTIAGQRCGLDLRPLLFPVAGADAPAGDLAAALGRSADSTESTGSTDELEHAETAHPFLFTVQYALATLLAHWGVRPDLVVGYSLGEYVGACLAGVFSLSDALYLVVERARLIESAPAGRMVAVAAGEQQVRAALVAANADVDIAAINGPTMTVLSGLDRDVEAVTERLRADKVACMPMRTAHAFHSALLEPARDKLTQLLDTVQRNAPTVTIVSNSTGTALTAEQATSREYWADHLVRPIRFADGVRHCLAQDVDVFVELGAGQTLGGLVRQNLTAGSATAVLGTLPASGVAQRRPDARAELTATRGRLWERGVGIDWHSTGRVVTLPTYPFQRTKFWPDQAQRKETATPVAKSRPADLCYTADWHQDPARGSSAQTALAGPLVVFTDPDGIGTRLADQVAATGVQVVEVLPGTELCRDGRRLTIDPANSEHHRQVFAALPAEGPVHVVHAWSLLTATPDGGLADDAALRASVQDGFASLLRTVQALGELPAQRGVRLITVSRGATEILGADAVAPHQAAVHGLARIVHHEYPGLDWRGVDLDPLGGRVDPATELAAELARTEEGPAMTGWRRGRRWLQDWAEVPLPQSAPGIPWRADGVYLITGGTRGLGMALAKHLVTAAGVRKLALVGRSKVERDDNADLAELTDAGAEVLLLRADVGVPAELRAALAEGRRHFGALHGVVHAAGLPAGGMARRRVLAEAETVLAPKILAMGPLADLVGPATPAAERPELLVLYSSAVTAFGGIGEGDYCAANSVLDAYGSALAATAPSTTVVSVGWGPWQHDAWQAGGTGALAERASAYRSEYGFADEAGCALLDRIAPAGHGSVIAVRQPMRESLREWAATIDLDSLVEGTAAPTGERFPRPQLRTEFVAPRTPLESTVAEVWQAFLGIDRVGVHDPFFDLGGNSLVGLSMVLAIEKKLDTAIAPAVLFEHPTVAEFAAAVASADQPDAAAPQDLLAISSARGQRRRRARATRGNED